MFHLGDRMDYVLQKPSGTLHVKRRHVGGSLDSQLTSLICLQLPSSLDALLSLYHLASRCLTAGIPAL